MLSRVTIRGAQYVEEAPKNFVLHVSEPTALVMAAGYLKYTRAKDAGTGILFRGQRRVYAGLVPTLYRDIKHESAQGRKHSLLNAATKSFSSCAKIFDGIGIYAHEPLLQHYGIHTTWIDLVDNVWVALWFACHRARVVGKHSEYMHFERRVPSEDDKYAYILLVEVDLSFRARKKPGYYFGADTELVDLRMAAPSVFLRPHAQHGYLFRKKGTEGSRPMDYRDHIRGIVRIDLPSALEWLGSGKMVNTHSLFPPPYYDSGYQILLTCGAQYDAAIGAIHHIGA
jgi:hypothetical protein